MLLLLYYYYLRGIEGSTTVTVFHLELRGPVADSEPAQADRGIAERDVPGCLVAAAAVMGRARFSGSHLLLRARLKCSPELYRYFSSKAKKDQVDNARVGLVLAGENFGNAFCAPVMPRPRLG